MAKLIKVLETNKVKELIKVLEAYKDKDISIFGSGLPIHIHEEGNHIILDEVNLEEE